MWLIVVCRFCPGFVGWMMHLFREWTNILDRTTWKLNDISVAKIAWFFDLNRNLVLLVNCFPKHALFFSDVVFDPSIVPSLVRTILKFLANDQCVAYIACTVRNSNTYIAFLKELGELVFDDFGMYPISNAVRVSTTPTWIVCHAHQPEARCIMKSLVRLDHHCGKIFFPVMGLLM